MSTLADHLAFATRQDFPFRCDPRLFSEEQYALIKRWGHWYQALADGTLKPITAAQLAFVEAINGPTPPTEPHAAAWWRYAHRLAIEEKHSDAMHRAAHYEEEGFYTRAMVKQQKKIMFDTLRKEHRK